MLCYCLCPGIPNLFYVPVACFLNKNIKSFLCNCLDQLWGEELGGLPRQDQQLQTSP
jgi:hypothetical protein